jgi:hypothetical protein
MNQALEGENGKYSESHVPPSGSLSRIESNALNLKRIPQIPFVETAKT